MAGETACPTNANTNKTDPGFVLVGQAVSPAGSFFNLERSNA
jgi:hypothetical protein